MLAAVRGALSAEDPTSGDDCQRSGAVREELLAHQVRRCPSGMACLWSICNNAPSNASDPGGSTCTCSIFGK